MLYESQRLARSHLLRIKSTKKTHWMNIATAWIYSLSLFPRLPKSILDGIRKEFVVYNTKFKVSQYHLKLLEG